MLNTRVTSYGWYSNDNYGVHCLRFDIPGATYYFSYETLIAFRKNGEFHIRKNEWGTTTGKHLNWINPDKSIREDSETFEENYNRLHKEV